jgi:hypothetical protein
LGQHFCNTAAVHELLQRLLRRGPKFGISRGVGVFGTAADGPALTQLLGPSAEFAGWASDHGVMLSGSPDTLAAIEARLPNWQASEAAPMLGNELGVYLGSCIVRHVAGAEWRVWRNGHPVVRLPSGRDLDVVDVVHRRLTNGEPSLAATFQSAATD